MQPERTMLRMLLALLCTAAAAKAKGGLVDDALHALISAKMSEARAAAPDPLRLQPFAITLQEQEHGFANLSLAKVVVEGLSRFEVRDVVTRLEVLRTSCLLRFPEVRVRAAYTLKDAARGRHQGIFTASIPDASATWVGAIQLSEDGSVSGVQQESFRLRWEEEEEGGGRTASFGKGEAAAEGLDDALGAALLERVQRAAREALERAVAHAMGRSHASWFQMFPPTNNESPAHPGDDVKVMEFLEEDSSPFVGVQSEGSVVRSMRRRKRQVPCENGENLDDYVDSLFKFGRRVLRFREPIPFPNTTVKIDDMLTIFLYNGGVRGVSNLERRKNAYVKCTNTTTTLGLVVRLQNLRVNVKYRVLQDYRLLLFNGDGEIRIREVIVLVQITSITNPDGTTVTRLDRLKIWKLGHVTVRLRGLGNLTSALSMLITRQVNEDPKAVIPVAEAQVTHVIRQELRNLTIPIFSLI